MPVDKSRSFYTIVPALYEYTDDPDYVLGDGVELLIESVKGIAPNSSEGWVALVWDYDGEEEEILFLTYGSDEVKLNRVIVGDGVKKLCLVLHNESGADLAMGGRYKAKELD
jgi:hypothetical protein